MDLNSRFYGCESLGFPAVSNYDYEINSPSRGLNNISFRWEEVAAESIYLLKEATASGSFESNLAYTGITNYTGVNYITTGNLRNTTSYLGWTISGNRTVYIGTSGIFVNSGDLPGVTSSFQAHPLDGEQSIGLYCWTGGGNPTVYANLMQTGLEGPFINTGKHQLYLEAKINYGGTGQLYAYPRGFAGGALVASYDSVSRSWINTTPTGYFTISGNTQKIKFDFICSNFPGTTPTGYDVFISNPSTGKFITVDNIHIDAYFKKNAFLDYLVPYGYIIQVTPDLGWHNITDMFEASELLPNPHLRTLGPFGTDFGNLTDNEDNSVTAIIDQSDFEETIIDSYSKYLWRAIAINDIGQPSAGGLPARFSYVGKEVDSLFVIDPVKETDSPLKVITGTRSKDMIVVLDDNETHPCVTYPSINTWRIEVSLSSSVRVLKIYAKGIGGSTSSIRYVELKSKLFAQNESALWNVFDEHGLVADIERLPGESNYDYSNRIKDVYKNRGGSSLQGILNGASRELAVAKIPEGLKLSILKDQNNIPKIDKLQIDVTSYSLRVTSDISFITEHVYVDPVYGTAILTKLPCERPEYLFIDNTRKIDIADCEIVDNDTKDEYSIAIKDTGAFGKFIELKYKYYDELLFKHYPTLEDLLLAINNLTINNSQVLKCEIGSLLSGNEKSLGLFISSLLLTKDPGYIAWSPIIIKKISDRGYRNYFLSENQDIRTSEYYKYVAELKNNTKIFWGAVEADRDRWGSSESKALSMDSIPTCFDPGLSHIIDYVTGSASKVDPIVAWGKNYTATDGSKLINAGLSHLLFSPGVAYKNDLKPSIYYTTSRLVNSEDSNINIGPKKNDNNIVLFSGQR